jgi:hypothetical protein
MSILDGLRFAELTKELLDRSFCFSCGDDDLDDFFNNEAVLYREKLMGKTYCLIEVLTPEETNQSGKEYRIIVAFTVANDSLRIYDLPNNRRKKLIESTHKHLKRYPGVLIGRLGVNKDLCGQGYGTEILNYIKNWFSEPENKTGCRFVIVDALNCEKVLRFYSNKQNKFKFLFSNEEQELKYEKNSNRSTKIKPSTRLMYFDLLDLSVSDEGTVTV